MKKLFVLAIAAMVITGTSFAQQTDGKKSGKECSKGGDCCKKATKTTAAKTAVKPTAPAKPATKTTPPATKS